MLVAGIVVSAVVSNTPQPDNLVAYSFLANGTFSTESLLLEDTELEADIFLESFNDFPDDFMVLIGCPLDDYDFAASSICCV